MASAEAPLGSAPPPEESAMTWTTPTFTELRFGFEVTMYIQNR
jgi:pyrroloquinoline quinone biosynthesis protein A